MFQKTSSELLQAFSHMTDQQWFEVLVKSIKQPVINGVEMPGFPSDQFQTVIVGSSGEQAIREAYNFYREIKYYASNIGPRLNDDCRILDFGCGWGRIIRFFFKDVIPDNLYGVDVDPGMIDICRRLIKYGNYSVVNSQPPTGFPDESIDIVYAYSVFSHLAESVHLKWVEEFSRILKPGGILIATTMARYFIEYCHSLRGKTHESAFHNALANSFIDTDTALSDYDSGKFLYSATGGGPSLPDSFYGITLIPRLYVEREWTKFLSFVDFIDDRTRLPQALIVMQKPRSDLRDKAKGSEAIIEEKDAQIRNLEFLLRDREETLNNIYNSRGWKLLRAYYKVRDKFLRR